MKRVQATSLEALDGVRDRLSDLEAVVLKALRAGNMTCTEISDFTGIVIDTVRPTVTRLKDRGLVERTVHRRPTRYGKSSIVWAARRESARGGQQELVL